MYVILFRKKINIVIIKVIIIKFFRFLILDGDKINENSFLSGD